MLGRTLLAAGLLVTAGTAASVTVTEARQQERASMLLTGHIEVGADGKAGHYTLDKADRIPQSVRDLVARTISGWRFQAAPGAARMTLSVQVTPIDAKQVAMQIVDSSFDSEEGSVGLAYRQPLARIPYPANAMERGVEANAQVLVEIDKYGHVLHSDTEQVNLRAYGRDIEMGYWRKQFADAAALTIRNWKFVPPSEAEQASQAHWYVVVPVEFSLLRRGVVRTNDDVYGRWSAYLPGPKSVPDWYVPGHDNLLPSVVVAGFAFDSQYLKLIPQLSNG